MNIPVSMVYASPAAWLSPVYVPSNSMAQLLYQLYNAAGTYVPVAAVCVALGGYVAVEYPTAAEVIFALVSPGGLSLREKLAWGA
jgi:hypothetical protein